MVTLSFHGNVMGQTTIVHRVIHSMTEHYLMSQNAGKVQSYLLPVKIGSFQKHLYALNQNALKKNVRRAIALSERTLAIGCSDFGVVDPEELYYGVRCF